MRYFCSYHYLVLNTLKHGVRSRADLIQLFSLQGGQSRDTHVVISYVLFSFFARFKVRFTIIFLFLVAFRNVT